GHVASYHVQQVRQRLQPAARDEAADGAALGREARAAERLAEQILRAPLDAAAVDRDARRPGPAGEAAGGTAQGGLLERPRGGPAPRASIHRPSHSGVDTTSTIAASADSTS